MSELYGLPLDVDHVVESRLVRRRDDQKTIVVLPQELLEMIESRIVPAQLQVLREPPEQLGQDHRVFRKRAQRRDRDSGLRQVGRKDTCFVCTRSLGGFCKLLAQVDVQLGVEGRISKSLVD